jgi:hypothetical protein
LKNSNASSATLRVIWPPVTSFSMHSGPFAKPVSQQKIKPGPHLPQKPGGVGSDEKIRKGLLYQKSSLEG